MSRSKTVNPAPGCSLDRLQAWTRTPPLDPRAGGARPRVANTFGRACAAAVYLAALCVLVPGSLRAVTNSVPYIISVSPVSAAPGGAQFTLTVSGANFGGSSIVNWGTTALSTTFVSSKRLTALVTAPLISTGGTAWITVTTGARTSNVVYLPVANAASTIKVASLSSTVGSFPVGAAAGDFNGDGILDLAVANDTSDNVTILLGNGDGTFLTHATVAVGSSPCSPSSPFSVTVADVNGDGHLDLVVGHDAFFGPSVLLGDGTGTFVLQAALGAVDSSERPMLADFDRDGKLDIVVSAFHGAGVYFYKGNGNGTFQAPVNIGGAGTTFDVAIGDFNEDGNLDVVATHEGPTNSMYILLGNGDGTFQAPLVSTPIANAWSIAVADLNKDGHLDIAVSSRNGGGIVALLGNGDGTFQTPKTVVATGSYQSIAAGDLNVDGNLDIIGAATSALLFLPGNGDGTFQTAQSLGAITATFDVVLGNFATGGGLNVGAGGGATTFTVFLPTVSLSPSPVVFGSVGVGTLSAEQAVTVTNNTSGTVTISGISFTGTNPADFSQTNTCTAPLVSAGTCTIRVSFTASAAGARSAVLNVTDNAPASPQTAALSGTGVPSPIATLAPAGLVFAAQHPGTVSAAQTVTLSNTGSAALGSVVISITGTNSADFGKTTTCTATLAAGANCTIAVTFSPSQAAAESASLSIADNAAGSPQTVALTGTAAQSAPTITWATPAAMVFGTALSATQLNATAGGVAGTFVYSPAAGTVLAVGSHTLSTTFTPSDTVTYSSATATASLTVTEANSFSVNAPPAPVQAVPGLPATAAITIPPLGGAFNSVVTLSASGLPAGATAVFNPATVTPGTSGAASILTVMFPASTSAMLTPSENPLSAPWGLPSLAASLFFLRRKRLAKTLRSSLLLAVLAASLLTLAGCSKSGFGAGTGAPRNIVITVTGTSGALHVSTTVVFKLR